MLFFQPCPLLLPAYAKVFPVAALHLLASALLAAVLAAVIFRVWYRPPYDALRFTVACCSCCWSGSMWSAGPS